MFLSILILIINGLSHLDHISIIKDSRLQWKIELKCVDIIFLSIVAVICGADGWGENKISAKQMKRALLF